MSSDLPPLDLSDEEYREWLADREAKDSRAEPERRVVLPNLQGAVILANLHRVFHPSMGSVWDAEYARIYPYLWFACQHPDRATDEAMLLEGRCPRCADEELRRGLPLPGLPPLPPDAPVFRPL
jgi:hypothetical protein